MRRPRHLRLLEILSRGPRSTFAIPRDLRGLLQQHESAGLVVWEPESHDFQSQQVYVWKITADGREALAKMAVRS